MHSKLPKLPRVKVILLYYLKINEKGIYIYPFGYVVFSFKQQRNAEKESSDIYDHTFIVDIFHCHYNRVFSMFASKEHFVLEHRFFAYRRFVMT